MATIVDYASLTTAITDFAHRTDIAGANVYTDYFIQGAIEKIQNDIADLNFGNYIRFMENAYPATPINATTGTAPVPTDWLAPKVMTVSDGSSDTFTLIFKSVAWIYDKYSVRQPRGIPAYIARDVSVTGGGGAFVQASSQQFTATAGQTVFTLTIPSGAALFNVVLDGVTLYPTTDYSLSGSTLTLVNGALAGQGLLAQYLAPLIGIAASTTSAFIFGPFPDSAYNIQGTYYQQAPMLSGAQTTNWMVLKCPNTLHAACMIKCGEFLENDGMIARWTQQYQPRLQALVDADKAERWAASTMQVEVG